MAQVVQVQSMSEVCWHCYLQYNQHNLVGSLLQQRCLDPHHHQGVKLIQVRYHQESGLLLRPIPEDALSKFTGNFRWCRNYPCPRHWCTYAHNNVELIEWNKERLARLNGQLHFKDHRYLLPTLQKSNNKTGGLTKLKHKHNYELPPESELDEDLLTQPLTRENYVDKFHTLLYYEEHEHKRVLEERCNKPLKVSLFSKHNELYGSLVGLNSNDVAYAQQAATDVEITIERTVVSAAITNYSVSNKGLDVVNIKFKEKQSFDLVKKKGLLKCVPVCFNLKHSYFQNLHKSLDRVLPKTVEWLVPDKLDARQRMLPFTAFPESDCLLLDKEYQLLALKKMMACDSSVPFLVTGPFGTGKTRLLATAAVYFLKKHKNRNNRILICTSHLQSADAYVDSYFGPMLAEKCIPQNVKPIRLVGRDYKYKGDFHYLFTCASETDKIEESRLVITTFLTAPQLIRMKGRPFTHILIDEGAQTREPEAIAPLGLANDYTKIVIAGDHLQIGPQMLVLGEKAHANGLSESLLLRLHKHYQSIFTGTENNPYTALLLTNYRCHDSILRLPSNLFFKSTLQVRSNSRLHPKTESALEFVCTSVDSTVTSSSKDYNEEEARATLEQVQRYIDPWPTAQWGHKDISSICVMASSRSQVKLMRKLLYHDFKSIKDIHILATYELQGREFRAVFLSTLEITKLDGSTLNPTKSICDQFAFNTVITRAQSLIVCVGNPFLLFSIEKSTPGYSIYCWREYVKRCLETSSLKLTPQCYEAGESIAQTHIRKLYMEVFGDLQDVLASPSSKAHEVSDSILEAYKRAFQSSRACQNVKVMLGQLGDGDRGYVLQRSNSKSVAKAPEDASMDATEIECHLEGITYRRCMAIPLDPKEPPITVQGVDNRRGALEGAQVKVRVYNNSDRFGRVCKLVEQGPQQQFVCRVDNFNAIFLYPIDRKNPKLINLPGLSREMLKQASNEFIIKKELSYKQRAVTVFDPTSFHIPNKSDEQFKIDIPQIKDVIPLSIAQKLLFVVCYLRWTPKYRYPLGVVIAAIPKGLTLYHGERLLLAHHHINTAPVDEVLYNGEITMVATTGSSLPFYDHAFTVDPPEAMVLDDALTLKPVTSDDGECYQLGVHITNVGGAVRKGSEVDNAALERSTAVYLSALSQFKLLYPDLSSSVYPILPEKVRSSLSLDCDKEASAISYTCQIHIAGKNVAIVPGTIKISESHMRSRARLTYEEVQHAITGVKDTSLDGKVMTYNKALSTTKTFGLQQRLAVLLQISESFFRNRVQSDDVDYSTEDTNQLTCPQAYFLVKELMVWANRIAAEHILLEFPQLALLRKQKPPNQDQLIKALEQYQDIVAHSPVHKTLANNLKVPIEPGPVVIMEVLRRHLNDALQSDDDDLMQAKNLLRITNYFPQLAVLCKEVNSIRCRAEYVCSSMLQQQKPLSLDGSYLVSLPQDVSEVYGHNDLCCLYTHSTSPLRRYIDIVVQRLILQSLSSSTVVEYSSKDVREICVDCNTKTVNARKVGKECSCLSIALSLAKSSQSCTVYISKVEKSLYFVIQELDYHCLSLDQCSFHLSSITSNAKPWVTKPSVESTQEVSEGGKTYVWKAKITSFSGELAVNGLFINASKCKPNSELNKDTMITFYVAEAANDSAASSEPTESQAAALAQHCYIAGFPSKSMSLGIKDWKKVADFMKLPSTHSAAPLKDLLGSRQCSSGDNSIVFPGNASFFLYEAKRSFKIYESFQVSFAANYSDHILSPCAQLLEVAPMLNVCVQHSTKPADCFSSPILSHASKVEYNDINEYIELWESVLLAEAAVQSVGEAEIQLIQNVPLKWPKLRQPGSSLDDVHYSPLKEGTAKEELADITLTIPAEFEERCGEYFDLQVGNLVCARYNIPLGEEKEVDGRKVTTASAVYHFIIHQIEDQDSTESQTMTTAKRQPKKKNSKKVVEGRSKVIHLKFASKDTARVSPFMKQHLKDSTCEIQVISLDLPYRRMYRSLLALRYTKNQLCKEIAVGKGIKRSQTSTRGQRPAQDRLVYELWSGRQLKELNREQKESVEIAMRNKFQLIQGPPGTGKSVTGSHLAYAFVASNSRIQIHPQSEPDGKIRCVMYCGPSNKSVDVVLDMFLKHPKIKDLRILRIYSKSIETKSYYGPHSNKVLSKPNSEQECSKVHEPYALHKKIRSKECPLSEDILTMEERFKSYAKESKLPSPLERINFNTIIKDAEEMIIRKGDYQIVFCTCNEASSVRVVYNIKPTHLIIDEAAMATEPEAMIPIQLADHVTLIGDHQQLQPVINYTPAKEKGLGFSLFERYAMLLKNRKLPLMMLTTQYRMHEAICAFPSKEFYNGYLKTDQSVSQKFCSLKRFWPNGPNCPIVFCDVEGKEEDGSSHHKVHQESKSNRTEAQKIAEIIVKLKQKAKQSIKKDAGIAVLTPYKAQKKLLEDIVKEKKLNVTVCTVNESQGSEFDFVIFSTVRSMPHRSIRSKEAVQADRAWIREHLGFITDRHQICVGITRAKHGLVIVGNSFLLGYDDTWKKLLEHYNQNRCLVKALSFPRHR